jgi:hypothetical protein
MITLMKLLFVGVSLHSYYFYSVGLTLISLLSLCIMGFFLLYNLLKNDSGLQKNASVAISLGYYLMLIWSLIGLLFYGESPDEKRFVAFLVVILSAVVAGELFRIIPLKNLVRCYLAVHVSFFYLQFITYYATGYTIDYLAPVTGEEQRMFGGGFTLPSIDLFIRASGLFNEPGTYVTFVAPFVALFERWYGESEVNKRLFWISFFSLGLSFSVFGVIFCGLILLFSRNLRMLHRACALITCSALVAPFLYDRFVLRPTLGLDTGLEFRQVFIEESLAFLLANPVGLVFGSNLLALDPRAEFVAAFNDIGLLLYLTHFAGPLLTLLIGVVLVCASVRVDHASRAALIIVLLSKHSLFSVFFPFILVAIFWNIRLVNPKNTSNYFVSKSSGAYFAPNQHRF